MNDFQDSGAGEEGKAHWQQLAREVNYCPQRLAERSQLSLRQLERRFKLELGFSPRVWLKGQRLKAALVRLQGAESIKEIAYSLHYCQVSHFCRDFKLLFAMTPSEGRRLAKAAQERLLALVEPMRVAARESGAGIASWAKSAQDDAPFVASPACSGLTSEAKSAHLYFR